MNDENLFLEHPTRYWMELENRAKELKVDGLIQEIVDLRGKVSFYESRIREMAEIAGI